MEEFPDLPMFLGVNAPSRIEVDLHDLEVEGELPRELRGAFCARSSRALSAF